MNPKKIIRILLLLLCFTSTLSYSQNIIKAEYFIDADPGLGNGANLNISSNGAIADDIQLTGYTQGIHILSIRVKDDQQKWSFTESRPLYISSQLPPATELVAAEYFIDTDPGFGMGSALSILQGAAVDLSGNISVNGYAPGIHTISIRAKDNLGRWSIAEARTFYISNPVNPSTSIITGEYFIDTDPGPGAGISFPVVPGAMVKLCSLLQFPSLTAGNHTIGIRTKDNTGKWSFSETQQITVIPGSTVSLTANELQICRQVTLTAVATGGPWNYLWFRDCDTLVSTTSNTYNVTQPGIYSVQIKNINGTIVTTEFADTILITAAPDNTPPVFTKCPTNISQCNRRVTYTATATDNCNFTMVSDWPSGSTFPYGITQVHVTATDGAGNSSQCTFSVSIPMPAAKPVQIYGEANPCGSSTHTYYIDPTENATGYKWIVPSGWTILSGQGSTSITVSIPALPRYGNVSVSAFNVCNVQSEVTVLPVIKPVPPQPGTVTGNEKVCANTSETYSVEEIPGVTGFNWTVPAGWTINSGQGTNIINVTTSATAGFVRVVSVNSCGNTSTLGRAVNASVWPLLSIPSITGPVSDICEGTEQVYSITPVSGATGYQWTLPVGWLLLEDNGTNIKVRLGKTGLVSVKALNACNLPGTARNLSVNIKPLLNAAASITGNTLVYIDAGNQTYSIAAISGALSYTWSVPAGWNIISGQGTRTIIAQPSSSNGVISVFASNSCGNGAARQLNVTVNVSSRKPGIVWDQRFGGDSSDLLKIVVERKDGQGYLIAGESRSKNSGDKSQGSRGGIDYWIVKTNNCGNKIWEKRFGGSENDYLSAIAESDDGSVLLAGSSASSIGGDRTQSLIGSMDWWVVKIDENGNKIWDRNFGNSVYQTLKSVVKSATGFLFAGTVSNLSTTKNDFKGMHMDDNGFINWVHEYAGNDDDNLEAVDTAGTGFILAGTSKSGSGGDKSQDSRGGADYWVVKISSGGSVEWDKRFGGSGYDQLSCIKRSSGNTFILGGTSNSVVDGDVTETRRGADDYWLVKINKTGDKIWDHRFGGTAQDFMTTLDESSDGGIVAGGYTLSKNIDKDKTEPSFSSSAEYWILKLDATGLKQWDKTIGGSDIDECRSLHITNDNGIILGGNSKSGISGYKTQASQGKEDYWIVKLSNTSVPASIVTIATGTLAGHYCTGESLDVPYSIAGTLIGCNLLIVQLSDASGSFNSPVVIGRSQTNALNGTVSCTLPYNITGGTGYRIRVVSYSHSFNGNDNGVNITIGVVTKPVISATGLSGNMVNLCPAKSITLTSSVLPSYLWSTGATTRTISVSSAGTYFVSSPGTFGCSGTSDVITVNPLSCTAPAALTVISQQSVNEAFFDWDQLPCAISYTLQWKKSYETSWHSVTSTTSSATVGYLYCQEEVGSIMVPVLYNWRVKANCAGGITTAYINGESFTTMCGAGVRQSITSRQNIDPVVSEAEIYAAPNPVKDQVTIHLPGSGKTVTIMLKEITGRTVMTRNNITGTTVKLDLRNISPGEFYLLVLYEDKRKVIRLTKL